MANNGGQPGIIVRRNVERNGIEIKFPESPGREIITRLQYQGFRWHPKGKYWWAKKTDARIEFAKKLQKEVAG